MSARTLSIVFLATFLVALPAAARDVGPDGRIAYASYEDGDYDIYVADPDGSNAQNLTDAFGSWADSGPAWSPDGLKIAFNSERGGNGADIVVMNADGSNQLPLTEAAGFENFGASWSPDGTRIAFTSTREEDWEVFVMNADGSDETNLTGPHQELAYDDLQPDWSPDGQRIVFTGVRDGAWEVLSMNSDGTGETSLTADDDPPYANINWYPSYRPDGSKIVYMSQPNDGSNDWDLWVMNPDGTGKEAVLPDDEWQDVFPRWSPDGNWIVFSGNRSGLGDDLFMIPYPPGPSVQVVGVTPTQITHNGTSTAPDWGSAPAPTVTVTDSGPQPRKIQISRGETLAWRFAGPSANRVEDESGMGLFESGLVGVGGTYEFAFVGAGAYRYHDALDHVGTVKVPVTALPASGALTSTFTVTWAAAAAPAGYVFDVQARRPGGAKWLNWRIDQTGLSSAFVPDAGVGLYSFRARLERTASHKRSGWSPAAQISVG